MAQHAVGNCVTEVEVQKKVWILAKKLGIEGDVGGGKHLTLVTCNTAIGAVTAPAVIMEGARAQAFG